MPSKPKENNEMGTDTPTPELNDQDPNLGPTIQQTSSPLVTNWKSLQESMSKDPSSGVVSTKPLTDEEIDALSASLSEQSKEELVKALNELDINEITVELDDKGKRIVKSIVDKCSEMNIDWFYAIAGGEGCGKSSLIMNLFAYSCQLTGYDPIKTLLRTLIYDEDELLRFISSVDPKEKFLPINLDEGANVLFNRESMGNKRRYILKFFNVMRFLNAQVFIATPNIRFLDKNVREHRVKSIFYIPQRGVYWFYDKKQVDRMNVIKSKRRWIWVEPREVGTYGVNRELEIVTTLVKENYVRMFSEKVKNYVNKRKTKI